MHTPTFPSGTSPASAGNSHHPLLLCHKGLAASLPQQHHLHKCFKPASHPVSSSSPPSSFRLISNFPYVFSHHTASRRPSLKPPPKHSFAPLSLSSRFTSVRFYSSYSDNIITLSRHPACWKQAFFSVTPPPLPSSIPVFKSHSFSNNFQLLCCSHRCVFICVPLARELRNPTIWAQHPPTLLSEAGELSNGYLVWQLADVRHGLRYPCSQCSVMAGSSCKFGDCSCSSQLLAIWCSIFIYKNPQQLE